MEAEELQKLVTEVKETVATLIQLPGNQEKNFRVAGYVEYPAEISNQLMT